MTNWHGYFGIENINLNAEQRQTLVTSLQTLGPTSHNQPCMLNHWRTRLDGEAVLFEALFDEDVLTVQAFKNYLTAIFGADAIDHVTAGTTTPVVTFSKGGVDYLRVALFGGVGATWDESHDEVLAYLATNQVEWEEAQ